MGIRELETGTMRLNMERPRLSMHIPPNKDIQEGNIRKDMLPSKDIQEGTLSKDMLHSKDIQEDSMGHQDLNTEIRDTTIKACSRVEV